MVMEGLGTKNLVADEMAKITGKSYYDAIAQDTVAMIVNDLIVVGAAPEVVTAYFAVGDSGWFTNEKRAKDLLSGWANACLLSGAIWGGGETPTLSDIVAPATIDLAGSAIGRIAPKTRLVLGEKLVAGDAIILIESSGIHANGLTLARAIASRLPKGYGTPLENGELYGEALLRPTHIYSRLIQALFEAEVDMHSLVNITGHGWRKLMRANKNVTYRLTHVLPPSALFSFIQRHANASDEEMYGTLNMGAGFAVFVPPSAVHSVCAIAKRFHLHAWLGGMVEAGDRQVIIEEKGVVFSEKTLQIRV
jgi:phosphoribosylformylglycinamidine cyclo-ligase